MKWFSRFPFVVVVSLLSSGVVRAGGIDMDDPRRALGREGDVRIDAQLAREIVSPGVPISVTYQVQNFSTLPVAIANKVSAASYDADSLTITISLGSEVPQQNLPHIEIIAPGEKKVFHASALPAFTAGIARSTNRSGPRYVQVRVSILRDLEPFRALIDRQTKGPQRISDELFDRWFESNDTIFLNTIPIQFRASSENHWSAEQRSTGR